MVTIPNRCSPPTVSTEYKKTFHCWVDRLKESIRVKGDYFENIQLTGYCREEFGKFRTFLTPKKVPKLDSFRVKRSF